MRVLVDAGNKDQVREMRNHIRNLLGRDAENVFGEAIENVRKHTEEQVAEVTVDENGFEVRDRGPGVSRRGAMKFFTNRSRQSGYGLLIMTALGADVTTSEDGTTVRWQLDPLADDGPSARADAEPACLVASG